MDTLLHILLVLACIVGAFYVLGMLIILTAWAFGIYLIKTETKEQRAARLLREFSQGPRR